ncbi:PPOX class F420-dependent oxidoreductase [Dactylosporangium matsuzakiense]|uniref:PPOX class F420-dependent enzyme n=1 Tax=Dactylosporangium matsuzakiense TaxID=53360 RepID=A0A9W6NMX3_9ACTN|nr:PPOX class F420-dependent oxidoreductase [Dactylosporangium matsuzakiense]UWZ44214.1 PPOX class F420-dependent oxidoreductase [Dactylosporangium matsuzakiense]GLL03340.1 PPOX class F420-dependent enzyme [Dactylosporangium matsuzakiense]
MDLDEARTVLTDQHHAVLATRRKDGGVQMSPVAVAVDAEGRAVISSRLPAYKVRNLQRDPRAALCVLPDGFFGRWIQVEGEADIVLPPDSVEGLVDYYRRATGGEHPDWDDYRAAMIREQRVLIRVTLHRAGPDKSG